MRAYMRPKMAAVPVKPQRSPRVWSFLGARPSVSSMSPTPPRSLGFGPYWGCGHQVGDLLFKVIQTMVWPLLGMWPSWPQAGRGHRPAGSPRSDNHRNERPRLAMTSGSPVGHSPDLQAIRNASVPKLPCDCEALRRLCDFPVFYRWRGPGLCDSFVEERRR